MGKFRDKIAHFIATPEVKKRIDEGVTDDNFFDYGAYVNLIAKTLRRFADDRHSYTPMGWKFDFEAVSREDLEKIADSQTALLHKWADILEIHLDIEEPYYKEFNDHLDGMATENLMVIFPEYTDESKKKRDDFYAHELAILNLKSDILSELGANFMYMWD